MKNKILLTLLLGSVFSLYSRAQNVNQPEDNMQWWRDARFGMFIHWGLYSVPAGEWGGKTGYGEWIRTSAEIPLETYDQFRNRFDPVEFNAEEWVMAARDAGMKYIVITSKHHDGFCMFDTKQTDFNIMNTPWRKDPMKDLAEACRKYGLKFCFYYSIMDWHHPDYLPRREWEKDRGTEGADFNRYKGYMKSQLKELLTRYGDIGVLWFDGEWESTWNQKLGLDIYRYCKSIQPKVLINNRVGAGRLDMEGLTKKGMFGGDFGTPEQQIPPKGLPGTDWETCMTMNDHWGYNRHDKHYKSTGDLIRMLTDVASKGGNYLLNVGPDASGSFPVESTTRLNEIGRWMKVNGEAVYGTVASPLSNTPWGRCTLRKEKDRSVLYLHVFEWPENGELRIQGCMNTPAKAWLLADKTGNPLRFSQNDDIITLYLPSEAPDSINTVIGMELPGTADFADLPGISADYSGFTDTMQVRLFSSRENIEIRYNFSAEIQEVSAKDLVYTEPVVIVKTGFINARCYRNGKPVSGTASRRFEKKDPIPAVQPGNVLHGLNYTYFEGKWDSVPDFREYSGEKGVVDSLTLEKRKRNENFAFEFNGFLKAGKRGMYRFTLASDDAGILYLDDREIINHDGLHAATEKSGEVALDEGFHKFRIAYVQRTGSAELRLFIESPGTPRVYVTKDLIYHE